jgi:uncharacterized protein (TIGR03083 family)
MTSGLEVRMGYEAAAEWFLAVVESVREDQWDEPGLGVWTVRELAAHALRSFSLIGEYAQTDGRAPLTVSSAAGYYDAIFSSDRGALHAAVAARGKASAAALGDSPADTIRATATEVLALLPRLGDDRACVTPFGTLRLIDYVHTRIIEMVVHGLDLCRAIGHLLNAPVVSARLALEPLVQFGDPSRLLLAITGRELYDVFN